MLMSVGLRRQRCSRHWQQQLAMPCSITACKVAKQINMAVHYDWLPKTFKNSVVSVEVVENNAFSPLV